MGYLQPINDTDLALLGGEQFDGDVSDLPSQSLKALQTALFGPRRDYDVQLGQSFAGVPLAHGSAVISNLGLVAGALQALDEERAAEVVVQFAGSTRVEVANLLGNYLRERRPSWKKPEGLRGAVIGTLLSLESESAYDALINLILNSNEHEQTRRAAFEALRDKSPDKYLEAVDQLFAQKDYSSRLHRVALGQLKEQFPERYAHIIDQVFNEIQPPEESKNEMEIKYRRHNAPYALIGLDDEAVLERLAAIFKQNDTPSSISGVLKESHSPVARRALFETGLNHSNRHIAVQSAEQIRNYRDLNEAEVRILCNFLIHDKIEGYDEEKFKQRKDIAFALRDAEGEAVIDALISVEALEALGIKTHNAMQEKAAALSVFLKKNIPHWELSPLKAQLPRQPQYRRLPSDQSLDFHQLSELGLDYLDLTDFVKERARKDGDILVAQAKIDQLVAKGVPDLLLKSYDNLAKSAGARMAVEMDLSDESKRNEVLRQLWENVKIYNHYPDNKIKELSQNCARAILTILSKYKQVYTDLKKMATLKFYAGYPQTKEERGSY